MIRCESLHRSFRRGREESRVLRGATLRVEPGECVVLLGPSGSGKTTLLSILGCLLTPDAGRVWLQDTEIDFGSPGSLADLRRRHLGFVFQQHRLLPFLTLRQNLMAVGLNSGLTRAEARRRVEDLAETLGIAHVLRGYPAGASGGECQRVAIARSLMPRPSIFLADEPTAALDWENGQAATRLLIDQTHSRQSALLVVTHDPRLIPMFDRSIRIEGGELTV